MSTTGHYTRYINQYQGWHDNCDTMRGGPIDRKLGNFQVVHTYGNKQAFCHFDNYDTLSQRHGYNIQFEACEYTGKQAIQYLLNNLENIVPETYIVDRVFREINFYMFAYTDYIARLEKGKHNPWSNEEIPLTECEGHCVNLNGDDQPFLCNHHPSVHFYRFYCNVVENFTRLMIDRYYNQDLIV